MNYQDSMIYGSIDGYLTDESTSEVKVKGIWMSNLDYQYGPETSEFLNQFEELNHEMDSIYDDYQNKLIEIDGPEMVRYDELADERDSLRMELLKRGFEP